MSPNDLVALLNTHSSLLRAGALKEPSFIFIGISSVFDPLTPILHSLLQFSMFQYEWRSLHAKYRIPGG